TNLTNKTIHFYKKKKLITPPLQNKNNYHTYNQQHLNKLTLLHQTHQIKFNLKKYHKLITLFNNPSQHNTNIKKHTLKKI
ncbi:MerR family transcriptional regulator, partial [Bacillus thuringiensis]|nr:MerR family transcriptional regulator [Bacillus thuringiensis]